MGRSLSDPLTNQPGFVRIADSAERAQRRAEVRDFQKAELAAAYKGGLQAGDRLMLGDRQMEVVGHNPDTGKVQLADASLGDAESIKQDAYDAAERDLTTAWSDGRRRIVQRDPMGRLKSTFEFEGEDSMRTTQHPKSPALVSGKSRSAQRRHRGPSRQATGLRCLSRRVGKLVADTVMAKSQPTLDARIAAALTDEQADRNLLIALWDEALAAIKAAKATIETETARALDITNDDPDASDRAVRTAQRTIDRLTQAIPRLQQRVAELDTANYLAAWHAEADKLKVERDILAAELRELYAPFVEKITALYARIDANTRAISDLHGRAPAGEPRRLADAEQSARGLQFSAETPPLRDNLRLPDWLRSRDIAYPRSQLETLRRDSSLMTANLVRAIEAKQAGLYGPDWAAARALVDEQQRAEFARRDAALAAEEAEAKRKFEQSLVEADRRRRTGVAT